MCKNCWKKYSSIYYSTEDQKEKDRKRSIKYSLRPDVKKKRKERDAIKYSIPEIREKQKEYSKEYYRRPENTELLKNRNRESLRALKIEVMNAYGGKCECCGEVRLEFLTIEHSFGDGKQKRQEVGRTNIYRDLKKRGFPKNEGIQVLCFNCNLSRAMQGYCPHDIDRKNLIELTIKYNYK